MTSNEHFRISQERAKKYNIILYRSTRKDHKYMFKNPTNDKWVHFGAANYEDFNTHNDIDRRTRYRSRHAAIKTKSGKPAYMVKYSPAWASYNILW